MLLTVLANMIGFNFARYTEIVPAIWTAHSIGAHVSGSQFIDVLTFIIFVIIVYLSLNNLNCITTFTSDYSLILV